MISARLFARFLSTVMIVLAVLCVQAAWCAGQKNEEEMGREYSANLEKDIKLVEDAATLERVSRVGQTIAKIANEVSVPAAYGSADIFKFKYQFKVIDDKDVNALSLPGGIVYVNSGLVSIVGSDDELAGVLAHEVAHSAHHHMAQLMKKSSSVDRYVALVALAGILGKARTEDLNNIVMGAQMMRIGTLSGYTQEAEKDADRTAVAYLAHSSYKVDGMLSFMRKLETRHAENPTASLGIYQTHPQPFQRVEAITKAMQDEGLNPDLRKLRDVAYAKAEPVAKDSQTYRVTISKRTLYEPASVESATSKQRAEEIAARINGLLDSGISSFEVCQKGDCLLVGENPLLTAANEDTRPGQSKDQLLSEARSTLQFAIWADWLAVNCRTMPSVAHGY